MFPEADSSELTLSALDVYLIDDSKPFRENFRKWLSELKFDMTRYREAAKVDEGLLLLQGSAEDRIALCFLDLKFGDDEIDARDVIRRIQGIDHQAIIVVLTSNKTQAAYRETLEAGASDFRLKSDVDSHPALERVILSAGHAAFHSKRIRFTETIREVMRSSQSFIHDTGKSLTEALNALEIIKRYEPGSPLSKPDLDKLKRAALELATAERVFSDYREDFQQVGRTASPKPCELQPLISQILDMYAERIALTCDVKTCTVDEAKTSRILMNLLSNALKFSPEHSRVEVEVQEGRRGAEHLNLPDDNWIVITVRDHGYGVQEKSKGSILEYQTKGENCGSAGGLGVGLWCCVRMAEAHECDGRKGKIDYARPATGDGTIFYVALPQPLSK